MGRIIDMDEADLRYELRRALDREREERPRATYEYMEDYDEYDEAGVDRLNELGAEGWLLVSLNQGRPVLVRRVWP